MKKKQPEIMNKISELMNTLGILQILEGKKSKLDEAED